MWKRKTTMWVVLWVLFLAVTCPCNGKSRQTSYKEVKAKSSSSRGDVFTLIYQASQLEFDYPTLQDRQNAINSGEFLVGEITPMDFDKAYNPNVTFVTIPRFTSGVPASLTTVTSRNYLGNLILAPYPSWSWHQNLRSCLANRIVSVFRIKIDQCNRVWVLDNGVIEDEIVCPPQLLAFDLRTNTLVHRYQFPSSVIKNNSLLVTVIPDIRNPPSDCNSAFIYVADCQDVGLIVYNMRTGESWKIVHSSMFPVPAYDSFSVAGQSFTFNDGILGMDLSPYIPGQDRKLYYHALSSVTESRVWTANLRNWPQIRTAVPINSIFKTYPNTRSSQAAAEAIDKNGISYFGLSTEMSLNCWNTKTPYGMEYIDTLFQNNVTMQFTSGIKVIKNLKNQEELWFITIRLQRFATGTLNPNEINFRIQKANIKEMTEGSYYCSPLYPYTV